MGVLSMFSLLTMRIDAIVASPFRATTRAKNSLAVKMTKTFL